MRLLAEGSGWWLPCAATAAAETMRGVLGSGCVSGFTPAAGNVPGRVLEARRWVDKRRAVLARLDVGLVVGRRAADPAVTPESLPPSRLTFVPQFVQNAAPVGSASRSSGSSPCQSSVLPGGRTPYLARSATVLCEHRRTDWQTAVDGPTCRCPAARSRPIVIGLALALAPRRPGRQWLGDIADQPAAAVAIRSLAVRDVAIGAGLVRALDTGADTRPWLFASAAADAADVVGTVLAWKHLPPRGRVLTAVMATAATVAGLRAAQQAATAP